MRVSNGWFDLITGESMAVGRCYNCGYDQDIPMEIFNEQTKMKIKKVYNDGIRT